MNFIAREKICEFCADEYFQEQTEKLKDMPDDQSKTILIERIIKQSVLVALKPCVVFACKHQSSDTVINHFICKDHLHKMTRVIEEFEHDHEVSAPS